jgi:hypothetical protein
MAIFKGLDITKNNSLGQSYGYNEQLAIYNYFTTDGSAAYIHFKTNQYMTFNQIVTIEGTGYNYGVARPIKCRWSFYAHNNQIYDKGVTTDSTSGIDANGMYLSSDGYACIRAYTASTYFLGLILNAYTSGAGVHPFGGRVEITAVAKNSTSGNHF